MLTGEELGRAIRSAIRMKRVTQKAVAEHFGVKPPSIQDWLNRGVIGKEKLPELWRYFSDVAGPEHWGMESWPTFLMPDDDGRVEPNVIGGPDLKGNVPLISWIQAGEWCEVIDTFQPGDAEEWLLCPKKHGPSTFALRVRGVSMEPKYRDGAIIYVDPDISPDHLKNVVVRLNGDSEATFKQLVIEGDKRFLRPLNPDWPGPKLIEINDDATICGVVIGQFIED